jgi:hypothetical protein
MNTTRRVADIFAAMILIGGVILLGVALWQ